MAESRPAPAKPRWISTVLQAVPILLSEILSVKKYYVFSGRGLHLVCVHARSESHIYRQENAPARRTTKAINSMNNQRTMKTSFLVNLLGMVSLISLLGCAENENRTQLVSSSEVPATEQVKTKPGGPSFLQQRVPGKVIKNGEIYFETSGITNTRKDIDRAVKFFSAWVAKDEEQTHEDKIEQVVIIRVKAEKFDSLVTMITRGIGRFEKKEITRNDVTEDYLDLELRLRIKREAETRYMKLLERAKTVTDVLAIEKQAEELRVEIESLQGKFNYLKDRIAFSTLRVGYYQHISGHSGFLSKTGKAFKGGAEYFVQFLIGLIYLWPFLLLVLGGTGIRVLRKRKKI